MTSIEKAEKIINQNGTCEDVICDYGEENSCPCCYYCKKAKLIDNNVCVKIAKAFLKKHAKEQPVNVELKGFKVDLSWVKGEARMVLINAIADRLGEKHGGILLSVNSINDCDYLFFYVFSKHLVGGSVKVHFESSQSFIEVSVNNALLGKFPEMKAKEPEPEGYKVSLLKYKGVERSIISAAVQREAFKNGYSWLTFDGVNSCICLDRPFLFFDKADKCITKLDDNLDYFNSSKNKEISVNDILSGKLPKVN